jgi:hypothetical protein
MVSSKAKEEKILRVSDPTRTQPPDICAEAKVKKTLLKS